MKFKNFKYIPLVLIFSINIIAAAEKNLLKETIEKYNSDSYNRIHFIENKGQILQTDEQYADYISHIQQQGNVNIYLFKNGGILYQC